jgi:hypothetical protein
MFSNVALQGLRENLKVMAENPRRAAQLSLMYSAIPAAIPVMAERGLLSAAAREMGWLEEEADWLEKAYAKIPKFERVYRQAVPLPMETASGKQFYIPLPLSEMGMVTQGIAYHAINTAFADSGEDVVESARKILGDAAGLQPIGPGSIHPVLKVSVAVGQYLSGNNPMDYYRNREIIPKNEYRVSSANDWAHVGKYVWNNIGGSTIWRIDDNALDFDNKDWFEIALGLPVIGNPLGRFVRVSDKGLEESKRETKADKTLDKKRRKAQNQNNNNK